MIASRSRSPAIREGRSHRSVTWPHAVRPQDGCYVHRMAIGRRTPNVASSPRPMAALLHARRSLAPRGYALSQRLTRVVRPIGHGRCHLRNAGTPVSPGDETAQTPEAPGSSATAIRTVAFTPDSRTGVSRETVGRRGRGAPAGRTAPPRATSLVPMTEVASDSWVGPMRVAIGAVASHRTALPAAFCGFT